MRVFVRFCVFFSVLSSILGSIVSCGSNDQVSDLADRRSEATNGRFPTSPEPSVTPGSVCERASEYRYPEQIKYCNRDVDSDTKRDIFVMYDQKFGFQTTKMERMQFKIDHLVPLCLGGSNKVNNLWPQHSSIYEHTDPIEPFMCELLSQGKIRQAEAIQLVLTIKQSPFTAGDELRKLEARY